MPRKKDPCKPKGVKSAYICFTDYERKEWEKAGKTIDFKEFSTHCGGTWKGMDDEEKKQFHETSDEDRKRYNKEMAGYTPPSDSDSDEDNRPPRKKKTKKEKDPNAPKRPITAFFHFGAEHRPLLKVDKPKLSITEVASEIGARWRALTDSEKEPYKKLAEKDKARYEEAMEEYLQSKT